MEILGRIAAPLAMAVWLAWGFGASAHAQEADAMTERDRTARARAEFRAGGEAGRRGDWEEAAEHFRLSYELRPAANVAFNLAAALGEAGRVLEASEILRDVAADEDASRRVQRTATRRLAEVRARFAHLVVLLEGDASGVRVRVDGQEIADALVGVPAPFDPGHHTVEAFRQEERLAAEEVDVGDGEEASVTLTLPPPVPTPREVAVAAPQPEPEPETLEDESGSVLTSGWFWAGAIVLVAAAGVVAYLLLTSAPDHVCGNTDPCSLGAP